MNKKVKKSKKGFTLVELLVVIAIIGILAAVVVPNAFKAIEKSKVASAISDYKAIKTAALSYYSDTGAWPATKTGGADPDLMTQGSAPNSWNGPYMERWPSKNPWGGAYSYTDGASTGDPVGAGYKYITISGINAKAIDRLESELDGGTASGTTGVVRYDTNKTTVYLIISEQ